LALIWKLCSQALGQGSQPLIYNQETLSVQTINGGVGTYVSVPIELQLRSLGAMLIPVTAFILLVS